MASVSAPAASAPVQRPAPTAPPQAAPPAASSAATPAATIDGSAQPQFSAGSGAALLSAQGEAEAPMAATPNRDAAIPPAPLHPYQALHQAAAAVKGHGTTRPSQHLEASRTAEAKHAAAAEARAATQPPPRPQQERTVALNSYAASSRRAPSAPAVQLAT